MNSITRLLPLFHRSRVVLISLFLTRVCNLRCRHCFYYEGQDDALRGDELRLDELKQIVPTLPPFPWLILTGGEPFLRPDLISITELFANETRVSNITVPTNGLLIARIKEWVMAVKTLRKSIQFNINFSLYGNQAVHDRVTGAEGSWQKTMDNARELMPLLARERNIRLVFSVPFMKENQDSILAVIRDLRHQFPGVRVNLGLVRGTPREPEQLDINPERYREAARFIDEHPYIDETNGFLERFFAVRDKLMHRRIYQELLGTNHYRPCLAGRQSLVISEQGKVHMCELLPHVIGDLREVNYRFDVIYNSPQRRRWLHHIAERRCSCTHECNQTVNLLYDHWLFLQTLWHFLFRKQKVKK